MLYIQKDKVEFHDIISCRGGGGDTHLMGYCVDLLCCQDEDVNQAFFEFVAATSIVGVNQIFIGFVDPELQVVAFVRCAKT